MIIGALLIVALTFQGSVTFTLAAAMTETDTGLNEAVTLECHVRRYTYTVTKENHVTEDGRILECSGHVTVFSCWGRCDSSEVSFDNVFLLY